MNTVEVSIAGIAFSFDEEAYRVVRRYLDKLEAGYADNPDGREIIADIEARIAEIILDRQSNDETVGLQLAESIVSQLGYPDDFPLTPVDDIVETCFPRRLYRNPEGAKFGGVCSGLATYFNVDPVWIRLGIFAPLLLVPVTGVLGLSRLCGFIAVIFAVLLMLYFVLWLIIPKAKTPRQKLEMRGEHITAKKIERTFVDDIQEAAKTEQAKRSASIWSEIIFVFGQILLVILKIAAIFILFVMVIKAIFIVLALLGLLLVPDYMNISDFDTLDIVGATPTLYCISLLLTMAGPVFFIMYFLLRWLFKPKKNINKNTLAIIGSIWLLITVFTCVITVNNADKLLSINTYSISFNRKKEVRKPVEYNNYWEENWDFDENGKAHPKSDGVPNVESAPAEEGDSAQCSTDTLENSDSSDSDRTGIDDNAMDGDVGEPGMSVASTKVRSAVNRMDSPRYHVSEMFLNILKIIVKR